MYASERLAIHGLSTSASSTVDILDQAEVNAEALRRSLSPSNSPTGGVHSSRGVVDQQAPHLLLQEATTSGPTIATSAAAVVAGDDSVEGDDHAPHDPTNANDQHGHGSPPLPRSGI